MIHVVAQPEPDDFDAKVRRLGAAHGGDLWRACLDELYQPYGGICAYLAVRIQRASSLPTVDHYRPKSRHPELAYEWTNYRLASPRMNSRKGDHEDVLDPFEVEDDWSRLTDLVSMVLEPAPDLPATTTDAIEATIRRLKLNDVLCVRERLEAWEDYAAGQCSIEHLARVSPFVAREARRHGLLRPEDS